MYCALLACAVAMADSIPTELDAYVGRPDPSFAWSLKKPGLTPLHIRMTSQTWRNVRWAHDVVVTFPEKASETDVAILYITGAEPNPADLAEAKRLANLAHMPVAHLFQIPNQPLFGRNEDDLIAHTFEEFLKTGDTDWPLLFPMAKSAVRAMDALQETTKEREHPFKRFVVIGASKRGWTAWLVGALQDPRVIGIAPMVFDFLRMREQLKHQFELWGKYSEMIADYTNKGLDKVLDTPEGAKLVDMVDPWAYRSRITVPKLLVTGANDRYWSTDSMSLYWEGLTGPKYCSIVPNAGHLLGDMKQALAAIAGFARSCAGEFSIAPMNGGVHSVDGKTYAYVSVQDAFQTSAGRQMTKAVPNGLWIAESPTPDFRESKWVQEIRPSTGGAGHLSSALEITRSEGRLKAVFGEVRHRIGDCDFVLSTPVSVVR